jgi:radical SAM-linked protein
VGATGEIRQKIDVEFSKEDWARFYSHHDLLRFFERAVRRAGLPVRMTSGFNPKPRMVFPTPLALGIASECEHVEIEFCRPVDTAALEDALESLLLPGMRLKAASSLPPKRQGRKPRSIEYHLEGLAGDGGRAGLQRAVEELLSSEALTVVREGKRGPRSVEVRPSILTLEVGEDAGLLLRVDATAERVVKPQEVAQLLAARIGAELSAVRIRKTGCVLGF